VFRDWLAQLAVPAGAHPQLRAPDGSPATTAQRVAAKLVGRWPDGTPVAVRPDAPDPDLAGSRETANAFDFRDDALGLACPRGAHVRRMNPRGALPFDGKLVNRHRIIRRGLPYGPELPPGAPEDGVERGLIFACYQVDIERQFEFIQANWINDGNVFGLGGDRDPITGTAPAASEAGDHRLRKMTIPGRPPFFVSPLPDVVTVRGGEYFLVPGIDGLRHLATTAEQAPAPGSDEASTQKKATRAPRRPAARRRSTDQ
jgi:hypothetical protein